MLCTSHISLRWYCNIQNFHYVQSNLLEWLNFWSHIIMFKYFRPSINLFDWNVFQLMLSDLFDIYKNDTFTSQCWDSTKIQASLLVYRTAQGTPGPLQGASSAFLYHLWNEVGTSRWKSLPCVGLLCTSLTIWTSTMQPIKWKFETFIK